MLNDLPQWTHEEQQKAVEEINKLMAQGISSAEAIKIVADKVRQEYADNSARKE